MEFVVIRVQICCSKILLFHWQIIHGLVYYWEGDLEKRRRRFWLSRLVSVCLTVSRLSNSDRQRISKLDWMYSQTWAKDHIRIATTILRSHNGLLLHKRPLNNDHLSTTATIFGSQGRSLNTGLTVPESFYRWDNLFGNLLHHHPKGWAKFRPLLSSPYNRWTQGCQKLECRCPECDECTFHWLKMWHWVMGKCPCQDFQRKDVETGAQTWTWRDRRRLKGLPLEYKL